MSTKVDEAVDYFAQGYNCAQSTAAAFASEFGLDVNTVMTMMAGFGAGLGGARETCGAVSAMAYVAGLQAGPYAPDDLASKKKLYHEVKQMVQAFTMEHGTVCCRDLLKKSSCAAPPDPSVRNAEYYAKRPCTRLVATAAAILEKHLEQK